MKTRLSELWRIQLLLTCLTRTPQRGYGEGLLETSLFVFGASSMAHKVWWLAAVSLVLAFGSALADENDKSIMGWGDIVNPDGEVAVKMIGDALTITIPAKHHDLTHTDAYSKLNAPRVLQPVDGDFTLSVVVKSFPIPKDVKSSGGDHVFQSSGLLIWIDDKNFMRIERAAAAPAKTPFVWVERFAAGKSVSQKFVPVPDKDIPLRVARTGDRVTVSVVTDDTVGWSKIVEEDAKLPPKLLVGVAAISSTAREFPAQLKELKLEVAEKK
jgi:regulation of enolase protein 1 (concanavalin A-like superfamily)